MTSFFNLILAQPLFNLLVVLYSHVTFGDLGLAIILLTIIVRLLLYPIFYRGLKSQMLTQKIQPEIAKAQQQYKDDKQAQTKAIMEVYKKNNLNPFASILYILIQLPIFFAIYHLFATGLTTEAFSNLYSFIPAPEITNSMFLGILDISKPSLVIVALAAIAQYYQGKMATPAQASGANPMMKYMVYLGPLLTVIILPSLSAGIGLYWTTNAVFSIFQQHLINKQLHGTAVPSRKN
jgi:YidC/Oxa1 family membrane protein insertase